MKADACRTLVLAGLLQVVACGSESAGDPPTGSGGSAAGGSSGSGATGGGPASGGSGGGQIDPAVTKALDAYITQKLGEAHLPGISAAIVRDGSVIWTGVYGNADIASNAPVTSDTLFELASVSKTVTVTALMQLWEQGKFDLDDDVSTALPFTVQHPDAPTTPITFREVLAHTSSIKDSDAIWDFSAEGVDCPIALGDFLANYFTPGGAYYDAVNNFHSEYGPGEAYDYSNVGIALAGFLVERISGQPLDEFSRTHVLTPLGMSATKWGLADLGSAVATPYEWTTGGFNAVPLYGYPDWPSGGLYSNAGELARFLAAFTRGGELDGARILSEDTVNEIRKVQFPSVQADQGLVWYYQDGGQRLGHDGSDWGWSSQMFFRVVDGVGVVVLTNGDSYLPIAEAGLLDIEARLFADAALL